VENPINPIPLAIVGGATYVARGFSGKQKHLIDLLKGAIMHKGFSFVDIFSPASPTTRTTPTSSSIPR